MNAFLLKEAEQPLDGWAYSRYVHKQHNLKSKSATIWILKCIQKEEVWRYSTKFISYKDLKPFMADLKLVYKADTEDLALTALEDLEEKWGKRIPCFHWILEK